MTLRPQPQNLQQRRLAAIAVAILVLAPVAAFAIRAQIHVRGGPAVDEGPTLASRYGALPLAFEPARGQAPEDVDFVARGEGYQVSLGAGALALGLPGDVVVMELVDADPRARLVGESPLPGRSHYLRGADPADWITDVPHYERVRYVDVWPGVDMVVYGTNGGALEYDFVLAPGADPDDVRVAFRGSGPVRVDDGALVVPAGDAEVRHLAPVVLQTVGDAARPVEGAYRLLDDGSVGFALGAYDSALGLLIDPIIEYSTFVGGDQNEFGRAIDVDAAGNAYVAGETNSASFPTVAGSFDTTNAGNKDAFVFKLNQTGTGLLYSTFLGGTSEDSAFGVAVDGAGSAYVTGHTFSSGFPTTVGAFDTTLGGSVDTFVTKLNATGSGLLYSTFLGGANEDEGRAIAVDTLGTAFVTGRTKSVTTGSAADRFPGIGTSSVDGFDGGFEAFLVRVNATGNGLLYSTLLGGTGDDEGLGVAVDPASANGHAYVTGFTNGGYDTTAGVFDASHNGGRDVFVSKINTTAATGALANLYGTYLGNSSAEQGNGIAAGAAGVAYLTGQTESSGYPTASAFDASYGGNGDAFVTALNATGASLVYSTFLGGASTDDGFAIAVDDDGQAHVTGRTVSSAFPTVSPTQTRQNGDDAFVTVFAANGQSLTFSTYLGGSSDERGLGIAVDAIDDIYVTGQTTSTNFPTTPGAFDRIHNGNTDVFVTKFGEPEADLALTKDDSPDPVLVDTTLTYFLNLTNAGPNTAENVTVNDTLPPGTTFVSATPTQGTCSHSAGIVTCALGSVASGAAPRVNITVTPTEPGLILNTANVNSTTTDPDPTDNVATETTLVVAEADLGITKEDAEDPVEEGGTILYFLNVTNAGPTRATNVTVSDTLPAGTTFGSATPSQGSCSESAGVVTCDLGTLAANATATISLSVTANVPGLLLNTANVTSDDPDPTPANDTAFETTLVTAQPADLSITKDDAPDPVEEGDVLTYFLNVTNDGPGDANNVTVQDALPASAAFESATPSQGSCAELDGVVTCDLGTMAANGTATIVITVRPGARGAILNVANVTADETDPDPSDNNATETTTVTPRPVDLNVTKTDDVDPVGFGQNLTYTIVVQNLGPGNATNVTLDDVVAPAADFVLVNSTQGSCAPVPDGPTVTIACDLGDLPANNSAVVTLVVRTTASGVLTNTANATSNETDLDPTNNVDVETTLVLPPPEPEADLVLAKMDDNDPALVGGTVNYTLNVRNDGPDDAENVTVLDDVPASFVILSATASQGTCGVAMQLVTCSLGGLANGSQANVTIRVRPTEPGVFVNAASVSSDTVEADPTDNFANETTTVGTRADLRITKEDRPDPVRAGQTLTYHVNVTNDGPTRATNVTVVDVLPANVTFVSATPEQGACIESGGVVTCDLGDMAAGARVNVTILVTPTTPGEISNTANVTSDDPDPDTTDNEATARTTVLPQSADVSVAKDDSPDPVGVGQHLTYTVVVTNEGPDNATNVTLVDTITPPATLVSVDATQGSCANATSATNVQVTCDLGTLAPGASAIVTIVVSPLAAGTLTNVANASADQPDANRTNNVAQTTTTVTEEAAPEADLSLTKSDDRDPVRVGGRFNVTLAVANGGPDAAENVTVLDNVPESFDIEDVDPSQGSCDVEGNLVTCDLGTLADGANATIRIELTATEAGTFENTAVVTSDASDPDPDDNRATEPTTVIGLPPPGEPPAPPEDLRCVAREDGNFLQWSESPGATGYEIQRAEGDGAFGAYDTTTGTTYLDDDVVAGQSYRYRIVAFNDAGRSAPSAECTVVAVPFFGAAWLVALAAVGAVGAYAWAARRR